MLQLSGSIALSVRGGCTFTAKAVAAQSGGAAALVIINDKEGLQFHIKTPKLYFCFYEPLTFAFHIFGSLELDEMACTEKDTSLNISIPVLIITTSSGDALKRSITQNKKGKA